MANPLIGGPEPNGSDITIDAGDAQLAAYESRPASGGSAPAVIVIHENRGLVPYLRDVADGLASNGYIAVAPDLLSRDGGTASIEDIPAKLGEIPRERHVSDVQAVIAYLKAQSDVTRIGIIGFCFGGGITWRVATESEDIAAAVPFYGANPPLEQVPNIAGAGLRRLRRVGRAHQRGHRRHHESVERRRDHLRHEGVCQRAARVPQPHERGALQPGGRRGRVGRRAGVVRKAPFGLGGRVTRGGARRSGRRASSFETTIRSCASACAMSMRSNGSRSGPGSSPARTPSPTVTGNSSNFCRTIAPGMSRASASASCNLPKRCFVAISQAVAALTKTSFVSSAIRRCAGRDNLALSLNHQMKACVSSRSRNDQTPQSSNSSSGSGSKKRSSILMIPFRVSGCRLGLG